MPTASFSGTTVHYTCAGTGPALVLVAGTGLPAHVNYGHLVDAFAGVRDLLPRITAPTLVVGLTRDQVVPAERTRLVHEAIPGSEYVEIDSGHVAVFERPQELVAAARGFLLADS
jgi:pimeloyl-ACP methyl ester carboxylesterase